MIEGVLRYDTDAEIDRNWGCPKERVTKCHLTRPTRSLVAPLQSWCGQPDSDGEHREQR